MAKLAPKGKGVPRLATCALALLGFVGVAKADVATGFTARLACQAGSSYVLCTIPMSVDARARITYAQARILSVPKFLEHVGGTPTFDEGMQRVPRLNVGFVTRGGGSGHIVVEARAVVCQDNPSCPHVSKVVSAVVTVPTKK
jgi:hypothetical protein